jgi:hypothetical protein
MKNTQPETQPSQPASSEYMICGLIDKLFLARELLDSYQFYPEDHRDLVRDHFGHARARISDAIDLVYDLRSAIGGKGGRND